MKLSLTLLVAVGLGLVYLNAHLTRQFESLSWAVGAKIFARPLELYQGAPFTLDQARFELDLLNYQNVKGRHDKDYHSYWDNWMDKIFVKYLKDNRNSDQIFMKMAEKLNGEEFSSFMMGKATFLTKLKVIFVLRSPANEGTSTKEPKI